MAIIHIVLFEFKPTIEVATINDVCQRMLSLRTQCIHPQTQKPYIRTFAGGRDNSLEGRQGGLSHGFVVEFENEEDRNYYIEKDPAHFEFVKSVEGIVESARVVDFESGVF